MKQRKLILAILFLICVFIGFPIQSNASTANGSNRNGLERPTMTNLGELKTDQISNRKYSMSYSSEWEKYGSYFYYNQLNETEKKLYDDLNKMCIRYIEGTTDINEDHIDMVTYSDLTSQEAYDVMIIFYYSNPQYYFLKPSFYQGYHGSNNFVAFGIYDAFKDGEARKDVTTKIKEKIEFYITKLSTETSLLGKEKKLYELIAANVKYEAGNYDQSVYSLFIEGKTVCAGYAGAFALLCNAIDIDAAVVTSSDHAWNYVRLNDSWYNVDATWGDLDENYGYTYTYQYLNYSRITGDIHHTEETMWNDYLPICDLDTNGTLREEGALYIPTATVTSPTISIDGNGLVTITSMDADARIFYTTDGSAPAVSYKKSNLYTQPFTIMKDQTVKAIAVSNRYYDSNEALKIWQMEDPSENQTDTSDVVEPKQEELLPETSVSKPVTNIPVSNIPVTEETTNTGDSITDTQVPAEPSKRSIKQVTISGLKNLTYSGKSVTQKLTIKYGSSVLVKNKDYTLTYKNNKKIGKATVTINGKGTYTGTRSCSFQIQPKKVQLKGLQGKKKAILVSWKKDTTITGYEIQYSTKKNFTSKKTVKIKKVKLSTATIKKLAPKKKYYVRIRSYKVVQAKTYYGHFSTVKNVKTK
ncbi:transglutaminase-like predicted protease domain fused ChW-repeats and cell-adhesion domain [Lachnospiraceae bacterium KM106-2]|nr:transglutaminase-like predicted protease domain fused ChW-repeats and cell-adhesion domain [Lachnospiraceae bacterium KM106-2]